MAERPKRRPASQAVRTGVKQLEERLAKLEDLLETVRKEATRTSGAARLRLLRIDKLLASRIAGTQATLKASLDRMSEALTTSRKSVEEEVTRLTRGLRAGVKAGREAYRGKRPG